LLWWTAVGDLDDEIPVFPDVAFTEHAADRASR
jgi:hypothetical protein